MWTLYNKTADEKTAIKDQKDLFILDTRNRSPNISE